MPSKLIGRRLTRADYETDSETLGVAHLGRVLVRRLPDGDLLAGRIVETEAYAGAADKASHAFRARRTFRNESMYARAGTAYVYFTYGMHYCMNVVCGEVGEPIAVLLRALEPLAGVEAMRKLRGVHPKTGKQRLAEMRETHLCSGPARLCQALGVDRALDGADLVRSPDLWLAEPGPALPPIDPAAVVRTSRIGVDYAEEWAAAPLRFLLSASPHVSKPPRTPGPMPGLNAPLVKPERAGKLGNPASSTPRAPREGMNDRRPKTR